MRIKQCRDFWHGLESAVNRKTIQCVLVCAILSIALVACDARSDENLSLSNANGADAEPKDHRLRFEAGDSLVAANQEEAHGTYEEENLDITWLDLGPGVNLAYDPPILYAGEGLFILSLAFEDDVSEERVFAIVIDTGGNIAIGPKYRYVHPFSDGMARVAGMLSIDGTGSFEGFIDHAGEEAIPLDNRHFGDFHEGLAISDPLGSEIMMGQRYIDKTGTEVLDISPDIAGDFYGGRAWFYDVNTKLNGYMDQTGAKIIPAIYNVSEDFHEGVAFVEKDEKAEYIDKNGDTVISFVFDNELSRPQVFSAVDHGFYNGLAYINGGYINKTGEFSIPAGSFSEGAPFIEKEAAFVVSKTETGEDTMTLIDRNGNKLTVPGQYLYYGDGRQDGMIRMTPAEKEGFVGALNPKGEELIPPDFKVLTEATDGHAMVVTEDETGRCGIGILKVPKRAYER